MSRVLIVGGGAAGMCAAVFAARSGHRVQLFEKNEKLGKKLFLTGKGRCNLTNACGAQELPAAVISNEKFLYSSFSGFDNRDAMAFFEELGLRLKVERGGRVFPLSDHSSDVIRVLERELARLDVQVHLHTEVRRICTEEAATEQTGAAGERELCAKETAGEQSGGQSGTTAERELCANEAAVEQAAQDLRGSGKRSRAEKRSGRSDGGEGLLRVCGLELADGRFVPGDACILATGGLSYPSTGSTGDGHRMARELGHRVTDLRPSLVPVETEEAYVRELMGLSLRNVELHVLEGKKELFAERGEMLFTHFGVSGPLVLTASARIGRRLEQGKSLRMVIDLKPALTEEQLDARVLREFEANRNKQFKNALDALFPAKLTPVMVRLSGIAPEKKVHEVTRAERRRLVELIRHLPLTPVRLRGYEEAIITQGGVAVKEVDPSTMESRWVKGLYFAGELLDVDAVTGGFNLQIAWSTGCAAGRNAGAGRAG